MDALPVAMDRQQKHNPSLVSKLRPSAVQQDKLPVMHFLADRGILARHWILSSCINMRIFQKRRQLNPHGFIISNSLKKRVID